MGVAIAAGVVGAGLLAGGTAMGASAANKRRRAIKEIANTPGLDFNALTGEALSGYESYLPRASALSGKIGLANQEALNAMEESSLPGLQAARQKALGKISGLFDEDSAWLKGLQRRGAALGLSSGLAGSQAGQLQTLRLSDQEGMQRTQLGTGMLNSLIGSMRVANTPGAQAFLGPSISEQIGQRANERSQRMSLLAQRESLPTGSEMWGNMMSQAGGMLMGGGLTGMMGGGGMVGGGGAGAGATAGKFTVGDAIQQQNMMSEFGGGGGMGFGDYSSGISGFGAAGGFGLR